jgi:hypothetical protein
VELDDAYGGEPVQVSPLVINVQLC